VNNKITLSLTLAALVVLASCAKSSTGRNQIMLIPSADLNKMGISSFAQMKEKEKISSDQAVNNYVQCVAKAITVNVPKSAHEGEWEVVVFDSEQVNAFALPGGKIGVYTGILKVAENQNQLGAIIGHEVGHVIENHSNERMSSSKISQTGMAAVDTAMAMGDVANRNLWMSGLGLGLQYGVLMPYGRTHESEADIVGQDLMAKSGFDPAAAIDLWQNMAKLSNGSPPEFMSTHPSNKTRIDQLTAHLPKSQVFYQSKNAPTCKKPNNI
jgi:predicted Zn-dependent protease